VTILFVEDNANTARAAKVMLELHGHAVDTAGSVADALAHLAAEPYDVLVSDILLPDGTGYDIISRAPKKLHSVALTGFITDSDREEALSKGFSAFLPKPFRTEDLIAAIEMVNEKS